MLRLTNNNNLPQLYSGSVFALHNTLISNSHIESVLILIPNPWQFG